MKKSPSLIILASLSLILLYCSCASTPQKIDTPIASDEAKQLFSDIENLQKKSPAALKATIVIKGTLGKKKFQSIGSLDIDRTSKRMRCELKDLIFESHLVSIYQDNSRVEIYSPSEKTLYRENANTLDLQYYFEIPIPYQHIESLLNGLYLIIKEPRILKAHRDNLGNRLLLCENKVYYQTLSVDRKGRVRNIKITHKKTGKFVDINIPRTLSRQGKFYFRNLEIVSPEEDLRLVIQLKNIKFLDSITILRPKLPSRINVRNRTSQ